MSVVGIDFGNLNTVIAVARNRGIDVIANETSNRLTPSMVSFGHKQRHLGEQAKSNEISNFRNTVHTLKRLAGRPYSDPEVQSVESRFLNCQLAEHPSGEAAAAVHYLGEHREFTFTQLCAAFFTKVKEITQHEIKVPVTDVVLSVPGWFGDRQRRAILDAAEVAGLNVLRLLNDQTAAALGYGITKLDLPEPTVGKPRRVVIVDIGHSSTQASCVEFVKGQLRVRGSAYDRNLGGRDFDLVLAEKAAEDAEKKYKGMEVRSNKRAMYRLRVAAEKAKKMLSANSTTILSVESLVEDRDVSVTMERADFEALAAPLVDRVLAPMEKAMSIAGWTASEVDALELIGGSTRIPAVKAKFAHFFGDDLSKSPLELKISTTMNADEAVARGNALMCAMISPIFKVREFAVQDWNPHPVEISWDGSLTTGGEQAVMEAFPLGNAIPSTKQLTFYRKLANPLPPSGVDFSISLGYLPTAIDQQLPPGLGAAIGQWTVTGIKPIEEVDKDRACVRVKAKLSADGVFSLIDAQLVEEKVVEDKKDEPAPMDTDSPAAPPAEGTPEANSSAESLPATDASAPKTKKTVKKYPLQIKADTPSLRADSLSSFRDIENSMASQDKLVADTEFAKNALEEYIYFARDKLDTTWAEFTDDKTKEKLKGLVSVEEEWLYSDEGEEATKSTYQARLGELKKIGDPIQFRFRDAERRPAAEKSLRDVINGFVLQLTASDDRYAHIAVADIQKCKDEVDRVNNWLNEEVAKQNLKRKDENPSLTTEQIEASKGQLVSFVTPIITRPKPATKKEEKKAEPAANGAAPEPEAKTNGQGKPKEEDTEMD